MAASIYATPPPDLSSEDTALSDVSNSSTLNTQRNGNSNSNNNNTSHNTNTNTTTNTTTSPTTSSTTHQYKQQQLQQQQHHTTQNSRDEATSTTTINKTTTTPPPSVTTPTTTAAISVPTSPTTTTTMTAAKKQRKRSIAEALMLDGVGQDSGSNTNASNDANETEAFLRAADVNADDDAAGIDSEANAAAMNAVAAAANAAMQLRLLEAINDAAKKRRKQHNPSRHEALNLSGSEAGVAAAMSETNEQQEKETNHELSNVVVDYEEKLSKMFLPKSIEQLKEQFEMLQQKQQQQQQQQQQQEEVEQDIENISQSNDIRQSKLVDDAEALLDATKNPYQTYCKQCGENFETEFKLSLHMLQEHPASANGGLGEGNGSAMDANMAHGADNVSPLDFLASVKVKLERGDSPTGCNENEAPPTGQLDMQQQQQQFQMQQHHQQQQQLQQQHGLQATDLLSNGKDHWLNALPPPGFPGFPPEAAAAAALSAGGYLPLLGVGVPGFPGVDGLNRPPLRIFNPEAYCELCNKEFCNKYFLKTHKANKHGIYDPAGDAGGNNNNSNSANNNNAGSGINAMNQMFQLQMQQQQQQQQQQHQQQQQQQQQLQLQLQQKNAAEQQKQQQQLEAQQALPAQQQQQQLTPPAPPAVHCDICSKRFTNIFAMRRHRAKIHEQRRESPNGTTTTTTSAAATPQVKSEQQTSSNEPASNAFGSSTPTDGAKPFQMPEGFRQDFTLEQEEVSFTPQPRKLSPQMQQQARDANFAHDKLRRLGVVNPEAFCEICCKEYCNKYFLRTHKWKRHGIFVPPEDLKDEQLQLAQKMAWPFMNLPGMPLNLMLANEKAVAAQRMLAAAAAASVNVVPEQSAQDEHGQSPKRIKLEPTEQSEQQPMQQDEYMDASNAANAQAQSGSMPGTPEPQQKSQQAELLANLPPSPEAAMQNLQKLQSMLQQLNDLNGKRPVACHLCGRELEHQYALQAHIMTEHAGLTPGLDAGPLGTFQQQFYQQQQTLLQQQQQQQQQHLQKLSPTGGSPLTTVNELRCQQCERDFNTPQEFKQHIAEVHLLPSGGSPLREGFFTPERPINPNAGVGGLSGGASARPPYTITPTSSYCEICNKELCNKYFMKTHMQRMHGIEIENGAQIGGVVCNICNKELCSKYFLRVHKHNTHGIIEEGAPLPQPRGSSSNSQNGVKLEAQQAPPPVPQPPTSQQIMENELSRGPNMSPFGSATASSYLDTCPLCTRHFRSFKWLRSHLMNDHGAAGIDKLRELEQQYGGLSKSNSPTLKIPNGVSQSGSAPTPASALLNPANLAQALQNLNAQHLLEQKPPKHMLPGMFGAAVAEQALQSPRYKEYQCSLCNFTTPYYAFLFIHERSHAITDAAGLATEPQTLAAASSQVGANNQADKTAEALPLVQEKLKHETPEPTNLSTRTPTPTTSTPNKASPTPTTSPTLEDETAVPIPQRPASKHQSSLSPVIDSPTAIYTTTTGGNLPPSSSSPPSTPTQPPPTRVLSPTSTTTNGPQLRSAATSPIESLLQQRMLSEMAAKSGKPTSYALPKLDDTTSPDDQEEYQMQAFHIECVGEGGSVEDAACAERLMPAIIYLPVRKPIVGQAKLSFNLTPA